MTVIDKFLQQYRIKVALQYLPSSVRLIDIGAFKGELFHALGPKLRKGFGVEPLCPRRIDTERYTIATGFFPDTRPDSDGWDAVTMLAVLEHIPRGKQRLIADACQELLRPGGQVIITVPSPKVDYILDILRCLRLVKGMSLEEHYGFSPAHTMQLFAPPHFRLLVQRRFQLGLNNLFVFERLA